MRSILFGILALLALIVVSALTDAHAQGGGQSQGNVPQAPVGHRQPTPKGVENVQENSSANDAMRKTDENLKKKLQGICRGC
jgi:uncharacterized protein YdeI (BOF family)